jgi:hypothetical protein
MRVSARAGVLLAVYCLLLVSPAAAHQPSRADLAKAKKKVHVLRGAMRENQSPGAVEEHWLSAGRLHLTHNASPCGVGGQGGKGSQVV